MSHELYVANGKASMAYTGEPVWHNLGNFLTAGAPIDQWKVESGMTYTIQEAELSMQVGSIMHPVRTRKALYRDDTNAVLGIVGQKYSVVQPDEVLEFFRDLSEDRGFSLESAGVLFNGSRYWALARTPHDLNLGGDELRQYLMLATACDGSMATTAKYVNMRVVCWNTLSAALNEKSTLAVRVEHRSKFNAKQVKQELKLADDAWKQFSDKLEVLAKAKVDNATAAEYLIGKFGDPEKTLDEQTAPTVQLLFSKFAQHDYIGADIEAANGTLWGLANVVTEYIDHQRGELQDRRLQSAWFGKGMRLKDEVFADLIKLAA